MHEGAGPGSPDAGAHPASRWVPPLVAVLSALVVVGPGLRPGYLLLRDMVFVPDPPLTARLLGLGHENARAVPSDLVVTLASQLLPGDLVQKLVLLAVLTAAGIGAAALVPRSAVAGAAAALAAVWNPFVGERLAMGQWALLVGYAALPFVLRALVDVLRGDGGRRTALALALVLGSLGGGLGWVTLGIGLLAGCAALASGSVGPRAVARRGAWAVGLWLLLALPWAVPALTRPQPLTSDPQGFGAFAPRPDTVLGSVGSLLTGGGVWNAEVVQPGRATAVGGIAALLLLLWSVAGYALTRGAAGRRLGPTRFAHRAPVLAAGVVALVLALLSTLPALLEPLAHLPGGGLLRDGSRQLGPWVLAVAVGCGWGVRWLAEQGVPRVLVGLAAAAPLAVLPSIGWGLSGQLHPVDYPQDVRRVATALASATESGSVAVLPFEAYRRYDWNGGRSSMTPWSRLVGARVVASSDLVVVTPSGPVRVAGEDEYAVRVGRALQGPHAGAALGRLGVGWLVADVPGVPAPPGTSVVSTGPDVTLLRVDAPVDAGYPERFDPPRAPVLLADAVWLLGVLGTVWWTRRRSGSRGSSGEGSTFR